MSVPQDRESDRWLHKKKRIAPWIVGCIVTIIVGLSLGLAVVALSTAKDQRKDLIGLVCDQNRILIAFITEPPNLPRDGDALRALREERCDKLLKEVGLELK